MFHRACLRNLVWVRYIIVAYDLVRDIQATNDMLFDGVGYGHSHCFLEWNFFRPFNELLSGGKDLNVPIQGQMDRSGEIKPPSVERFVTFMSWRFIGYAKICWRDFFLPQHSPYDSKITSENGGSPICYIKGRIWFLFVEDLLCYKQRLHTLLSWLLILGQ